MSKSIIFVLSLLAMVGCTKSEFDNTPTRNRVEMSISAVKEIPGEDTRIEFGSGVYDMLWQADDKVGVYVGSTGEKATFTAYQLGDDRKSARFKAEIYEPEALDDYYAFYPSTTPFSGSIASFIIPYETTGATTPMLVASTTDVAMSDVALQFKPVTALLELTLGFAADKIIVEGNNGEPLAGVCAYNFGTNTQQQPQGSTSITLTSPSAGTYYLHLPAITLSKGYKVTAVVGSQSMIKTVGYGKEKKFVAGEVTSLSIPSFEPVTVNLCDVVTTYTLYTRKDAAANTTDAHTIFFNGNCSYSGISSTLVQECGVVCGSTTLTATATNKQFSVPNQTGKSQGSYKVYAYIKTVDGITYKSAEQTMYITGLPYSVNCKEKSYSEAGWSATGTIGQYYGWRMIYWYFKIKESGDLYSLSFYTPSDINITYTASVCYFSTGVGGSTRTLYSGVTTGTTPAKTFSDTLSRVPSNWYPADSKFTDYSHNATLPKGNGYRIYIADEHNMQGNAAENAISMRQFVVKYRW